MSGQGTIVATGSIAYPPEWSHSPAERLKTLGVSKVMTMSSTYDHRIIQGAESGSFLRRIEELLQRRGRVLRGRRPRARRSTPRRSRNAHPASASAPPLVAGTTATSPPSAVSTTPDEELLQAVQAATSLLKAYRTHGHLAGDAEPARR